MIRIAMLSLFQFYIIETQCELYCRDLLFMSLFMEPPNRMGLQGRPLFCHSFLLLIEYALTQDFLKFMNVIEPLLYEISFVWNLL